MKITPEIRAVKNAYMNARSENNRPEMNRLKAKAMALMNKSSSEEMQVRAHTNEKHGNSIVTKNEDGDELMITSTPNIGASKKPELK